MLISHRIVQLGVVNQKRPEIWQSYLSPPKQQDNIATLNLNVGNHTLRIEARDATVVESRKFEMAVGAHRLINTDSKSYGISSGQITTDIGNHKLVEVVHDMTAEDNTKLTVGVGAHTLSFYGIRAESLSETNTKISLSVGDHKLYEEQ